MLKISIVDDEKIFREKHRKIIEQELQKIYIECQIKEFKSIPEFLEDTNKGNNYDIIFLDIEMGDDNGIKLAKYLSSNQFKSIVVFVTSYEKYMKDSFGLNVYQYILKEDVKNELPITLNKIINELYNNSLTNLKTENGLSTYKLRDIIYFTIQNRKIYMQTRKEFIQVYYTSLKKIKLILNEDFILGNSQYIINMEYIKSFENGVIELDICHECIFIPKGKVKNTYNLYKSYLKRRIQAK